MDGPGYDQACLGHRVQPDGPHVVCLGHPDDRGGLRAAYQDDPGDVSPEAFRDDDGHCSNAAVVAAGNDASRVCWSSELPLQSGGYR